MQTKLANTARIAKRQKATNKKQYSTLVFVGGIACLGALTGCVGYVDGPGHATVYAQPPTVYVQSEVAMQDDYVYYPGYQVYYSGRSRQYVYREGRAWVSRPRPPHVSAEVLFSAPSVNMGFHDSPAAHHEEIVRSYPKNWAPPGSNHGNKGGNKKDKD
ncbi:MAG: hypothetical protein JWR26_2473 [Pedosphaera sp.]|nr:hypothetical protein [Pedosphaera sp.]